MLDDSEDLHSESLMSALTQACDVLVDAVGADATLNRQMQILRRRLQQQRLQIAILGQFKRGKSTFINALLGVPILPTGVVPLTAIPVFIAYREKPLIDVQFSNGESPKCFAVTDITAIRETLARFVTEEENPKNRLHVDRVELFYPAGILADGTVLIDTPGIGSTLAHNTEAALRVLPECDASLFVVSADPPITEAELSYLRRLKKKIGQTFFIINKIDYLTAGEQKHVSDFLRKVLLEESLIDTASPIFAVSARMGLSAKQQNDRDALDKSGILDVETHIRRYLAAEKMHTLKAAVRRKAADILAQASGELELRASALRMPLEQLERKSSEFTQALSLIETQRLTVGDVLAGDRRRLMNDLEAEIERLRGSVLAKLTRVIDDCLTDAGPGWEDALKSKVSIAIEESFGNAGEEFVDVFSRRANEILADHRRRVDALVSDVRCTAAEMFNVALPVEDKAETFRLAQEPYWVTERVASTLIPDFSRMIDRFALAALRRRRRRSRLVEQANELIIRNAESLRWAILRGLDETFRAATAQLEERLGDAVAATKGVIEDALERRRDRSCASAVLLERLNHSMEALAKAQKALLSCENKPQPVLSHGSRQR